MFNMVLPCQILKKKFWAEIPTNFAITKRLENSNLVNLWNGDYLLLGY